jgi:hypothetical protein
MAQFTRLEVAQIMKDTGMVPLFYHKDLEISKKVITACYKGGVLTPIKQEYSFKFRLLIKRLIFSL